MNIDNKEENMKISFVHKNFCPSYVFMFGPGPNIGDFANVETMSENVEPE